MIRRISTNHIVFENADTGTSKTVDIEEVPEKFRAVDTPNGRIPIVRVIAHTFQNERTIREYGPDGQLLRSTVQLKS